MIGRPQFTCRWESAGLVLGPVAWGLSTQLNYFLAPYTCAQHQLAVIAVSLSLTFISFVAAYWSWASFRDGGLRAELQDTCGGHPNRMLALFGLLAGILFGTTIAVQC